MITNCYLQQTLKRKEEPLFAARLYDCITKLFLLPKPPHAPSSALVSYHTLSGSQARVLGLVSAITALMCNQHVRTGVQAKYAIVGLPGPNVTGGPCSAICKNSAQEHAKQSYIYAIPTGNYCRLRCCVYHETTRPGIDKFTSALVACSALRKT